MGKLLYKSKCLSIPLDADYKCHSALYLTVHVRIFLILFSLLVKYTGTFIHYF